MSRINKNNVITDDLGNAVADIDSSGVLNVSAISATTVTGATVNATGGLKTTKNAAPADGSLAAGDLVIWFDKTNGAGKLMVKAKTADGTVASGSVDLT